MFPAIKKLVQVMTGYLSKIVLLHIDQIWYKISLKKLNGEPFSSEEELKTKIKTVWKDCPTWQAIKQFVPRLQVVEERQGYCTKMMFGWLNNL